MIITSATKDDLIELGRKLLAADNEEEIASLYQEFNSHFSHPDAANLFYWPEDFNSKRDPDSIADYEPSVEDVVDAGIRHKSIAL